MNQSTNRSRAILNIGLCIGGFALGCVATWILVQQSGLNLGSDTEVYTLYRNSGVDSAMQVHVATFDTSEGGGYTAENCRITEGRFQAHATGVKYWCEKGPYRP